VLLEPNHGHYDSTWIRRQYEGSSVEIGPDHVRWTPPSDRRHDRGGFTVPIGSGPGRAHAVTRVRTSFPTRGNEGLIERYAVTDDHGTVLGSFPSGHGATGSGLPQHVAGWYPPAVVQQAVEQAGLVWEDRDFGDDHAAVAAAFPGVVPHVRVLQGTTWARAGTCLAGGALFLTTGIGWLVADGGDRIVFPLSFVVLGALHTAAGIGSAPPVRRRLRDRAAATR
jgi:hypothetical protein